MLKKMTDEELIAKYQSTLKRVYVGELFSRYSHLIFGACRKYFKETEDCKDMVMVIFEKIIKILPTANIKSFKSWLFVVVKNECISSIRKRKTETNNRTLWETEEKNKENFVESEPVLRLNNNTPESMEEKLHAAIAMLTSEQQRCVQLFFFEKKSYHEISSITGLEFATVKSRLQSSKRRLKRLLSQLVLTIVTLELIENLLFSLHTFKTVS